jgi:dihydroorotate dehydrogenase electron transfer subunit
MPVDVDAAVISNTRLSDDYSVIALAAPEVAAIASPGQFVMVKPSAGADPLLRRPFSIFQILRDGGRPTGITLLNKRVGVGTTRLHESRPGTRIACLGPLGRPFEPVAPPVQAWMVAGGVGLAPFLTLSEAVLARGGSPRLFYGARAASELYYVDLFERMGVEVVLATEDGSLGHKGFVTAPLASELRSAAKGNIRLYVCGPTPMMHAVSRLAAQHDTPCDVSLEQVMGCGLGGCYSCVVLARDDDGSPHFVRSCIEGPVFRASRIVWDALAH